MQLISSALKNEKGGIIQALVQLGIAEQLGAIVGGPYDRLGWHEGGVNGPDFDKTGASRQLIARMNSNPAVIPVRMLNDIALQQLRTPGGVQHPPNFAWRFDMVKDVRADEDRYGQAAPQLQFPTELDLEGATRGAALQLVANHHDWHANFGMPRRSFFYSNIGVVHFEHQTAGDPASPLVVVHELYAWDRTVKGPRGTTDFSRPWHEFRRKAQPYSRYEVLLSVGDEIAPDQPDVTP